MNCSHVSMDHAYVYLHVCASRCMCHTMRQPALYISPSCVAVHDALSDLVQDPKGRCSYVHSYF